MRKILKNISWRAWRVWQRHFDVYKATWKVNFIPPVLEPLLYLVAFGVGLGSMVKDVPYGGKMLTYLQFLAPGLAATAVMNHGFFETTYSSFVRMYYQRTWAAMLSTPLMLEDVILGEIVWGATKSFFAGAIMLSIACVWGLIPLRAALIMLPVTFLAGMTFSGLGICFTAVVRDIEMFNFPVFLFVTPMFLFSGVFFPIQSLPPWAQYTAHLLPLTFLVSVMRGITFGDFGWLQTAELLALLVIAAVTVYLGMVLMKKRLLK
ncbi:MAG: ABC transporter permease [Candidatus Omnitrophica bacterium]|nr:ABC transporter permease [Candidatus Omnitrophota bacterium]